MFLLIITSCHRSRQADALKTEGISTSDHHVKGGMLMNILQLMEFVGFTLAVFMAGYTIGRMK